MPGCFNSAFNGREGAREPRGRLIALGDTAQHFFTQPARRGRQPTAIPEPGGIATQAHHFWHSDNSPFMFLCIKLYSKLSLILAFLSA